MANGHGGYRKPATPAPTSGPGSLSRRTDGQVQSVPTGMPYGEAGQLQAQEQTAPMSATPNTPTANVPAAQPQQQPTYHGQPFGAPTARPNEPITAGVNIGAGPGPEALPVEQQPQYQQQGPTTQMLSRLFARDTSGALATLYQFAAAQGA